MEEIDEKVVNMIKNLRESRAVINWDISIAIAKAIITTSDVVLLAENGGNIESGDKWCEYIAK